MTRGPVPGLVLADVQALIDKRNAYARIMLTLWSIPGEPLIGIVSADEARAWHTYKAHRDHIDLTLAQIHRATTPAEAPS